VAYDKQVGPLVYGAMRATHDFRTFKGVHDLLHSRSESSMNPAKEWLDNFMDDAENRYNLTQEQKLVKQECQKKIIETNEFHGQFALIKSTTRIIVREGTSIQDIGKLKRNQFAKKAKKYIKLFTSDKTKEVDLKILKSLGRNKHL
jgi:hypothetical protein